MPLIRCSKCGQAYDVPGAVAVHLPNAIATCHCGEWLSGSKAAILARMLDPSKIKEIDLQPYRVDAAAAAAASTGGAGKTDAAPAKTRSIRVVARGAHESVNSIFTIHDHPLWIGRRGSHIELAEAELNLQHCSISVSGDQLVLRDAQSHHGTFLDGQQITEAVIPDGVHLIRAGSALITVEPTNEPGTPVIPIAMETVAVNEADIMRALSTVDNKDEAPKRAILICIDGSLNGQEFEIPPSGLVVGREGHVRVPDEFLSRKHFEVVPDEEGAIRVRDLGSRNGTFLNTLPANNAKVHAGDEIRAGVNRFKIEYRA